jgi:hypothetical protein
VRLICVTLLVSAVLAGCSMSSKPTAQVISGGVTIPTLASSNCWSQCEDYPSPPEQIKLSGMEPKTLKPGASVQVGFIPDPDKGSLTVVRWLDSSSVPITLNEDRTFRLPTEPGFYVYRMSGRWSSRGMGYVFAVRVEEM